MAVSDILSIIAIIVSILTVIWTIYAQFKIKRHEKKEALLIELFGSGTLVNDLPRLIYGSLIKQSGDRENAKKLIRNLQIKSYYFKMCDEVYYQKIINSLSDIQDSLMNIGQKNQYIKESNNLETALKLFYKIIFKDTSLIKIKNL